MHTIGMLLLAAATAGDGFGYDKPGVGLKKWLRPHVVSTSHTPPPGGPQFTAATMGGGPGGAGGAAAGRRFVNTRSQIYFLDPDKMNISWQTGSGPSGERTYGSQLVVPSRYNFNQGYIYRLKLSAIPGRPNIALYPTIEVAPTTPATDAYLAHNAIPVQFTAEDFDQVVDGGNFVTKVIYLPDPKYQEVAVSGVETLVSTRLEPGVDPILEADKRGTILLILRLGAIDLEMPSGAIGGVPIGPIIGSPVNGPVDGGVIGSPVSAPAGSAIVVPPVTELPPGDLPPGVTAPSATEAVPVDTAPAPAAAPKPEAATPVPPAPKPAAPAVPTPEEPKF
ncbi:MAG: hypothetical protein P4L85_19045 [Paludisphaera borealis]|uniref:hypothetical protein n=1 Tax=Paludisphaera borealis TaxID=1387353 RepID=UPI002849E160|nr:hypothetical protein [Paludisphaera borealis]MDR3621455.1 hypothetical protein [Paludisphaera borealis]